MTLLWTFFSFNFEWDEKRKQSTIVRFTCKSEKQQALLCKLTIKGFCVNEAFKSIPLKSDFNN